MKRPYLKHPLIVIGLIVVGWLALLLPAYLPAVDPHDYGAAEATNGYLRYVVLAFLGACLCILPVIIGALFLWLKKTDSMRRIDRFFLFITYLPALCFAFLSFCDAITDIVRTLGSIPAALIYLMLIVYLTFGFPAQTRN